MHPLALLFLTLNVLFVALAFKETKWCLALYLLAYFMHPAYWWWGSSLSGFRWSLFAGIFLVLMVSIKGNARFRIASTESAGNYPMWVGNVLIALLVNMTVVHLVLAPSIEISSIEFEVQLKYVLFFFMALSIIGTKQDLLFLLLALTIGLCYWGLEARFGNYQMTNGRLEGFGGPGSNNSNELASLVVTLLPVVGGLIVLTTGWKRYLGVGSALLGIDLLMICNSRGGIMGILAAVAALFAFGFAVKPLRKQLIVCSALGAGAFFLLAGNPEIMDRFMTSFAGSEDLDDSANSRVQFWKAGLHMVADYPLGSGGDGFSKARGYKYRQLYSDDVRAARDVHNGFIDEACNWGIQGAALRVAFLFCAAMAAWRTALDCSHHGNLTDGLFGICTVAATIGILVTSMFGSFVAVEWGYILPLVQVGYAKVCDSAISTESNNILSEENDPKYSSLLETQSVLPSATVNSYRPVFS